MKIGPFYIDTKELFLIALVILLLVLRFFGVSVMWLDGDEMILLAVLFLLIKGMLPAIHNETMLLLAIISIFLSLYLSAFQVLVFFLVTFFFFRLFRVM